MKINLLLIFSLLVLMTSCKEKPVPQTASAAEEVPTQWLSLKGKSDMPHVVFVSGDEEYRSEEALPALAKIMNTHYGFNCTVLFAQDPEVPGIINPNYGENIPGLEHLANADLMVNFTRFRALPDEQMQYFEDYLLTGKPVIGIRTATHAFHFKKPAPDSPWAHYGNFSETADWEGGFGRVVLGEKWINHHGHHKHQSTRGILAPGASSHPILSGIADGAIWGATDVYGVRLPMPGDTQPLVLGQVVNRAGEYDENDLEYGMKDTDTEVAGVDPEKPEKGNPNDPMMPVAWTKSYQIPNGKSGRVFASTLGASTDLLNDGVRRMYVNAIQWITNQAVSPDGPIGFVGTYEPTPFAFVDDEYWVNRNTSVVSLNGN